MTKSQNEPMKPSGDGASLSATDLRKRQLLTTIVSTVRLQLRDHKTLNRLVKGEEYSDRDIARAFLLCVDEYNITPPLIGAVDITQLPSVDLFTRGTIVQLMQSSSFLQARNRMVYSDGQGTRVNQTTNAELYFNWSNILRQQWKEDVRAYKIAKNLDNVVNDGEGVRSEYLLLSGFDE